MLRDEIDFLVFDFRSSSRFAQKMIRVLFSLYLRNWPFRKRNLMFQVVGLHVTNTSFERPFNRLVATSRTPYAIGFNRGILRNVTPKILLGVLADYAAVMRKKVRQRIIGDENVATWLERNLAKRISRPRT